MKRVIKLVCAFMIMIMSYLLIDILLNHGVMNAILPFIGFIVGIIGILYVNGSF